MAFNNKVNFIDKIGSKKTLVISVLGEQSSGKSTLLNFLFGTQYATSLGRCTTGVYGSILPLNNYGRYE